MKCVRESCGAPLRSDNRTGLCRRHKRKNRPGYWNEWYQANKTHSDGMTQAWRAENRDRALEIARTATKRWRDNLAIQEAAQAKASPKPHAAAQRLLALAEAKATQAKYGIERRAYA